MTKAGRNDPCPCGSGKKFKKCCDVPKQPKIRQASVLSSGKTVGKLSSLFQTNIQKETGEKKEDSPEGKSSLADKFSALNS
jgi:hypothetical protein